jgi:hypothetical protein
MPLIDIIPESPSHSECIRYRLLVYASSRMSSCLFSSRANSYMCLKCTGKYTYIIKIVQSHLSRCCRRIDRMLAFACRVPDNVMSKRVAAFRRLYIAFISRDVIATSCHHGDRRRAQISEGCRVHISMWLASGLQQVTLEFC